MCPSGGGSAEHPETGVHRDPDQRLLAELNAPPSIEQARESYLYWRRRRAELPPYKRAQRREADELATAWRVRLEEAERERYGPGLLERLLDAAGIPRPPNVRPLVTMLIAALAIVTLVVIAVVVVAVIFWPDLEPIIRTFLGEGAAGD